MTQGAAKRCGQDAKTRWFLTCLIFIPWGADLNGLLSEIRLTGPFHMEGECKPIEGVSVANAIRSKTWSCLADIIFRWLKMPNDNGSGILNREEDRLSPKWWHLIPCQETLHAQCLVADWPVFYLRVQPWLPWYAMLVLWAEIVTKSCLENWSISAKTINIEVTIRSRTMITSWSPFGSNNSSSQQKRLSFQQFPLLGGRSSPRKEAFHVTDCFRLLWSQRQVSLKIGWWQWCPWRFGRDGCTLLRRWVRGFRIEWLSLGLILPTVYI